MMYNCRYFKGDMPCDFSKIGGSDCSEDCTFFTSVSGRRLIIKLGAMGDVVRTTPILHGLRKKFPKDEIWWLTRHPEVLPQQIDEILPFNLASVLTLQRTSFDAIYNLDKDREACALASQLNALDKFGYTLHQGHPMGLTPAAEFSIKKGIDDEFSQSYSMSYLQEIFHICNLGEFNPKKHEYVLPNFERPNRKAFSRKRKILVGLNTGCGERWEAREWKLGYWLVLCTHLKENGYEVLLLGGKEEDGFNKWLAMETGVYYLGVRPILEFMQEHLDLCDVVVTLVTSTMHLALGMKKRVVVLNNIFNKNEFELYGRGVVVEPLRKCKCYYGKTCTNKEYQCMDSLYPVQVLNAIKKLEVLDEQTKK